MSDTNVHRVVGNLLVGTSHFFVDTTTNQVGINTSSPSASLDVATGDVKVGSGITLANNGTITATGGFSGDGSGLSGVNSDSGSWVKDDTNGLIYVANLAHKVGIGKDNPSYTLDVNGDINISSTSTLRKGGIPAVFSNWSVNGSNIYRSSGNVGIGVTDPDEKLEINGNLKFSYTSQFSADGEKFIEFNQGGGGIKWVDGNSQIIDDGHLRICSDDHIAFQLGSTSSSKGTERMGINSQGRNTLQGFEVKQQIIGYQISRFSTVYNYSWSSSVSGVWRDTKVIDYTRKKTGTKIMVRFTPNASKAMSDASYRTQYFRVNTRLKITTANGAVTYSSTLDDWNRFDYGFSELENMRYDCFDAGTLSGSSANQNISFTFQLMGDAPSGHVGRYGLNLWANGSPNNGIEIYEIINE